MSSPPTMEMLIATFEAQPEVIHIMNEGGATRSLPIPLLQGDKLTVAFLLFTKFGLPPAAPNIYPPKFQAMIDYANGRLTGIHPIRAGEFPGAGAPDAPLGTHSLDPSIKSLPATEFRARKMALHQAYDQVIPLFQRNPQAVAREQKAAVRRFATLFSLFAEKPMLPYYRTLGRTFFTWVDSVG